MSEGGTTRIPFVSRMRADDAASWLAALNAAMPGRQVVPLAELTPAERAAAAVAIVADPDPADLLPMHRLVWVQSLWAGVERMLSETQGAPYAIVRMNDPQLALTMAEAVLAWTLYLHRDMPRYRRQQQAAQWRQHPLALARDRRIGILGLGNLGKAAACALVNQGFNVSGWSRTASGFDGVETLTGEDGLDALLEWTDILVILLPLTPETRGLMDRRRLGTLPVSASIINFARGPIIDDDALLEALNTGHLGHAVLDVFATEPLPEASPYWKHPGVTVLPHISAPTNKATASRIVAANVEAYLRTGMVPPGVDRAKGY
jgi:glyoxylate/hydroxypyruvate reductase